MILLIHPPVAKPSEPPAGIARLSGFLDAHGVRHRILDASLEALIYLMGSRSGSPEGEGAWTKRALRNREKNLDALRGPDLYRHIDRYRRAVRDLDRVCSFASPLGTRIGLANYENEYLSPLRSADLIASAERPETDPFYGYFSGRLGALFSEEEPHFVGISLNYLSQALTAFSMVGYIRRLLPGARIILGGGLVTTWLSSPQWQDPFAGLVDHMVAGPGERALPKLLGFQADGIYSTPSYASLPLNAYLSPGFILPYAASTGCFWGRCSFCPEKVEGNAYAAVPPDRVMSDLHALTLRTGPSLIHLLDNAISPAFLEKLANDGQEVPWYGFARVDNRLADPDYCRRLKRAGCVMLKLGIESGDQTVLDSLEKGISIETASVVLRNLRQTGIGTYVYLIFGTPPEDEASARKTLAFTEAHYDCIDFLNLAIFNMPVCSSPREVARREFSEGDLSLYTDFVHPKGWDRRRVRRFLDREFKTNEAVSAILKREPPVFTSNHAPFFFLLRRG